MDYRKKYEYWLNCPIIDEKTKEELKAIQDNEEEIKDRFYKNLEFGTAGLRGKMGAGSNRLNRYVIAQACQGLANVIKSFGQKAMDRGVAISYDVRYGSSEYAKISAAVLAANGIKSYIYDTLKPTPMLSYAIRKLNTISGIMVTASHNPQAYNGYKVYWEEGSQILDDIADKVALEIEKLTNFEDIKMISFEEALESSYANYIPKEVEEAYFKEVLNLSIHDDIDKDLRITYSPFNGCGNLPVREILKRRGFKNVFVVKEQELPDPEFTTARYPNPENEAVFELAKKQGLEDKADILIGTDPDCDRLALCVNDGTGNFVFMNGNRIGALLTYYIFDNLYNLNKLPKNPVLVKSIVTGDLSKEIGLKYGVKTIETLTGFKNICGVANELEKTKEGTYILGYEESIGYCYGDFVRDKDGVSAAMMLAEMAAYYKKKGKNLIEVLDEIFKTFGYYNERQCAIEIEGISGQQIIKAIVEDFRNEPLNEIADFKLVKTIDYSLGVDNLPKQNCLKYHYDNKSWFALRPSGTEPKLKVYLYSKAYSAKESTTILDKMEKAIRAKMDKIINS